MLNAFALTDRESRYPADMVCCWASMCNISYEYNRDDSFPVALQKVVRALRHRDIRIYNFLVNTTLACGEIDLQFLAYCGDHKQCNATNEAYLSGAPIFTGFTDLAIHLRNAIAQSSVPFVLDGHIIRLRRIIGAGIESISQIRNRGEVLYEFSKATSGYSVIQSEFTNIMPFVAGIIASFTEDELDRHVLAIVHYPISEVGEGGQVATCYAWAIVPASLNRGNLFVARESLNGTMVIASSEKERTRIVAYPTVSDAMSGTFLIPCDQNGEINIFLRVNKRSDTTVMATGGHFVYHDRYFRGTLGLEENYIDAH